MSKSFRTTLPICAPLAYKRQRAEFQDLLYQQIRAPAPRPPSRARMLPAGIEIGSGVQHRRHPAHHEPGQRLRRPRRNRRRHSRRRLLHDPAARRAHRLYPRRLVRTQPRRRAGQFQRLYRCSPASPFPTTPLRSRSPPMASSRPCSAPTPPRPSSASSSSPASSTRPAWNRWATTCSSKPPASGAAQVGVPNADGNGDLLHQYLEMANVNSVTEIADLIAAQRAYEMNARVISGADEMMQSTTQMR